MAQQPIVSAECGHGRSSQVLARIEALEVKSAALRCNDMALCALKERMDELAILQNDLTITRQDVTELHWRVRNLEDRSALVASKYDKAPSDIQFQNSRSGHDITTVEDVEVEAKEPSTVVRQETKLEEAMVRLSTFCKELTAMRTDPDAASVEERALAADAAVNSKLDDVRGLLSSCLHHLRQGSTMSSPAAANVGETAVTMLTQQLQQQHQQQRQQLQPLAAGDVKRGASTSVVAARSAESQRLCPSTGAGNRRPTSQSAGQHAPAVGEQRRSSPSRTKEQQGRSQSRGPGSPGGSQQSRHRRPSAHPGTQEARDERHATPQARARGRSTSIPLESHNPVTSTTSTVPSGRSRQTNSLSSAASTLASGGSAGGSSVVTAAASRRACVTVSRGRTLGASTAKH